MKTNTSILTYMGQEIDFLNPDPHCINIEDIAIALSIPRA